MKILKEILATLRTFATLALAYAVYSAFAAYEIRLPTFQEVIQANSWTLLKEKLKAPAHAIAHTTVQANTGTSTTDTPLFSADISDVAFVCEMQKRGYFVQDSAGRLSLCIDKGVYASNEVTK